MKEKNTPREESVQRLSSSLTLSPIREACVQGGEKFEDGGLVHGLYLGNELDFLRQRFGNRTNVVCV